MVYGFEAMEVDDPHVLLAEEMMQLAEYAVIGGWLVDFFPSRKSWITLLLALIHADLQPAQCVTFPDGSQGPDSSVARIITEPRSLR